MSLTFTHSEEEKLRVLEICMVFTPEQLALAAVLGADFDRLEWFKSFSRLNPTN